MGVTRVSTFSMYPNLGNVRNFCDGLGLSTHAAILGIFEKRLLHNFKREVREQVCEIYKIHPKFQEASLARQLHGFGFKLPIHIACADAGALSTLMMLNSQFEGLSGKQKLIDENTAQTLINAARVHCAALKSISEKTPEVNTQNMDVINGNRSSHSVPDRTSSEPPFGQLSAASSSTSQLTLFSSRPSEPVSALASSVGSGPCSKVANKFRLGNSADQPIEICDDED